MANGADVRRWLMRAEQFRVVAAAFVALKLGLLFAESTGWSSLLVVARGNLFLIVALIVCFGARYAESGCRRSVGVLIAIGALLLVPLLASTLQVTSAIGFSAEKHDQAVIPGPVSDFDGLWFWITLPVNVAALISWDGSHGREWIIGQRYEPIWLNTTAVVALLAWGCLMRGRRGRAEG